VTSCSRFTLRVWLPAITASASTSPSFHGLIDRMMKPKVVLVMVGSGNIVLTGAKDREEIYTAFESIYPDLSGKFHQSLLPLYQFSLCAPLY
jgi:hypothetical protein